MAQAFEVTMLGTYQAQQIVNRLTFSTVADLTTVANSFALAQALGFQPGTPLTPLAASFFVAWLGCQTALYQMDELIVRNLFSVTDFYTTPLSGANWDGNIATAGGGSMSFVAQKLQTNRVRTDIRRGSVAMTPPLEAVLDEEGDVSAGHLALMQTVCDRLNAPPTWTVGSDTAEFEAAVFKKERYTVPDSNPPRAAYRYYTNQTLFWQNVAHGVTWAPVARVTSQTSRRIGKGA
jgi:hypothetical protein